MLIALQAWKKVFVSDPMHPSGVLTPNCCRLYLCLPEGLTGLRGLKESQNHMAKKQYYEIVASVWLESYGMKKSR